jgi:hypothetical protein
VSSSEIIHLELESFESEILSLDAKHQHKFYFVDSKMPKAMKKKNAVYYLKAAGFVFIIIHLFILMFFSFQDSFSFIMV